MSALNNDIVDFKKLAATSEKWLDYIEKKKKPKDSIERAMSHYCCFYLLANKPRLIRNNVIAVFLLPYSIIATYLYTAITNITLEKKDYVIFTGGNYLNNPLARFFPFEQTHGKKVFNYHIPKRRSLISTGIISKDIMRIVLSIIIRYPLTPLFSFSVFTHLCTINKIIITYNPEKIFAIAGEKDFTTSILTEYCEKRGVEYNCVMHGEYYLTPLIAFVRFKKMYIWDEYYKEILTELKVKADEYIVYRPKCFDVDKLSIVDSYQYYIGYYLQEFSEQQLYAIRNTLRKFAERGLKCKVRPHKRASDMKAVKEIFGSEENIDIEDTNIQIIDSYSNTQYITSVYSTVLSEAYFVGKSAVIDDISDVELYAAIKKVKFINVSRIKDRVSILLTER